MALGLCGYCLTITEDYLQVKLYHFTKSVRALQQCISVFCPFISTIVKPFASTCYKTHNTLLLFLLSTVNDFVKCFKKKVSYSNTYIQNLGRWY